MSNVKQEDNGERLSQFSVFEGDLVNRAFAKIGIGSRGPLNLFLRIVVLISITWVPMALAAHFFMELKPNYHPAENFFFDFAAYAQFFVGIPLFILAERIIAENMLGAARDFDQSGVIAEADRVELELIEDRIGELRRSKKAEIVCIALAVIMSLMTIGPELVVNSSMETWHVTKTTSLRAFTPAGAWLTFVALPIQIYWWVRWIWKIFLWYWYLQRISRFKLVLVASHPDHTGGISFLSEVQAKFAIVILAFGISNVVATIGYKLAIEGAPITLPPVWGPVVGFIIGAPLLFLSPLLLFTKQLHRTKKRALDQFRQKAMASALRVEEQWLHSAPEDAASDERARTELSQLNLLTGFYERITKMRVVPFDLRSAAQLIGSAIGPMIPLIPYFVEIPEPWQKLLEALTKWLPH